MRVEFIIIMEHLESLKLIEKDKSLKNKFEGILGKRKLMKIT